MKIDTKRNFAKICGVGVIADAKEFNQLDLVSI